MKRSVVAIALALVASSCGGAGSTPASPRASAPGLTRLRSTAMIAIEAPAPGESVPADKVHVMVALTGGTVIKDVSNDVKPDEGHMHLKLDGKTITLLAGLDLILNDIMVNGEKLGPLKKGIHILTAEFVMSNHVPFEPPVAHETTFRAI